MCAACIRTALLTGCLKAGAAAGSPVARDDHGCRPPENGGLPAAALRRHLEYVSRHLADQLGAAVVFRGDGGYELNDLLPPVLARFKTICGKAADAAQSWGNDKGKAEATALKFKLWENQPTELKVGLIGFGLSSAGILGSTFALDPRLRRESIDALQDTNVLLPLSLLPYSEYFPLSGFKYKLPTASDAPYTFQTEFNFDAWFKLAREKWNIPKVSLSVGVDSAYQQQSGFAPLTGGNIELKFGGGIVNLTGFYNEALPPTPMLISDPARGEPPVWLMRSLPGQLESNLPRGSGVFLTVDVMRLPDLFKKEVPKRDEAVQRKENGPGDVHGSAPVATPAVDQDRAGCGR